jgi:hypothetical protein
MALMAQRQPTRTVGMPKVRARMNIPFEDPWFVCLPKNYPWSRTTLVYILLPGLYHAFRQFDFDTEDFAILRLVTLQALEGDHV